jgi:hypothetical protein
MSKKTIDLGIYQTKGAKVFTGRDRGIEVREESKIDEIEKQYEKIIILIPDNIMSINPSFLEEFLFNVVTKLKKDAFNRKFKFDGKNSRYKIDSDLEEAIERILRKENALSKK